jgi:tape measure domain-containing protein
LATGGGVQGAVGALAGGLAFSGSAGALAAAGGITVIGGATALAARVGVEAETAQVRLKALTDQFGEYNQAQSAAARISDTLRISTVEAQDGFGKLYAALRPTGVTLQEIEDAFVGFTAAARASGATATESSAALLQLKQALGSGVLQGDELRSIREQAPAVGQAIAREMGVTIGELKKLGSEGQITTDIVLRALAKLKNEKLDQLNAQFNTSAQAMAGLKIATEDLGRTIAKVFGPTAVSAVRIFTEAIKRLNDATVAFRDPTAATAAQVIRDGRMPGTAAAQSVFLRGAGELFKGTSGAGGVGLTGLEAEARELSRVRRQPFDKVLFELMQNRLSRVDGAAGGNQQQQEERDAAASERNAARNRSAQEAADKANKEAEKERKKAEQEAEKQRKAELDYQNDLFNIRLNAERRLRDFREQSLERAKQMERDLADQRLELERTTEERRRRAMGQLQDAALMGQIATVRAGGGDPSGLEEQLKINQERRRVAEEILRNDQEANDRRITLDRSVEAYRLSVARGIADILDDAGQALEDRMRQGATAAAATLNGAKPGGVIARTGSTGDSTGPHLDGRWADRRPITVADLDRYVRVGGRTPSSFGVTSGYGPRRLFGRSFHAGVDVGTPSGTPISLTGGATFGRDLGNTGAGGYAVEIMTPEGPMRLLHLSPNSVRRPAGPANSIRSLPAALRPATAMQPMDPSSLQVPGMEGINSGAAAFGRSIDASRNAGRLGITAENAVAQRSALADITRDLDAQNKSIRDQVEDYQRLLVLQRNGLSPEIAQQRVEAERAAVLEAKQLQRRLDSYELILKDKDLAAEARAEYEAQARWVRDRLSSQGSIIEGLTLEQQALERLRDLEADRQQLIDGISGTIGNGLTSVMDALIDGTESWGDSLRTIASTVLKDIARQLAQIYLIQPATQGIQGLLGGLFPGGGGVAAAAAGGGFSPLTAPMLSGVPVITGAFANGGIMTPDGPLPLRTYASGGIASSPQLALFGEGRQPEAFVPLPDGRRIPVAMRGGGGSVTTNNVTVNVDATGSNVQSDDQQGRELGRVIAAAVQSELVKQKRPGGILTR